MLKWRYLRLPISVHKIPYKEEKQENVSARSSIIYIVLQL